MVLSHAGILKVFFTALLLKYLRYSNVSHSISVQKSPSLQVSLDISDAFGIGSFRSSLS